MKALLEKIREILRSRRTRQMMTRFVSGVAAVVVFVTTYALVLPAITLEQNASCGIPEHQHTDACYEERLVCETLEGEGHHHDASCYDKILICGQEVHVHSPECYQEDSSAVVSSGSAAAASTAFGAAAEQDVLYGTDGSENDTDALVTDSYAAGEEEMEEDSAEESASVQAAADESGAEKAAADGLDSEESDAEEADKKEAGTGEAAPEGFETGDDAAGETDRDGSDSAAADQEDSGGGNSEENKTTDTTDADEIVNGSSADAAGAETEDEAADGAEEAAAIAGTEEAANAATTNVLPEPVETENLSEGYVPELDSIELGSVLNKHTDFYYFHPEQGQDIPETSAEATDWKKVKNGLFGSTKLESTDLVKMYLAYTIPAGNLNETNQVVRYRLPSNIHLTDDQIIAINGTENGMSALYADAADDASNTGEQAQDENQAEDENAAGYQKYLGAEAIEGTRRPDQNLKEGAQEYISAIVKAENVFDDEGIYGEKGAFLGQDLIFVFTPYSIEKNQITYNADGDPLSAGEKITGWFACDFNMSQIGWVEQDTDLDNSTVEKTAEIVFVEKDSEKNIKEISRTLKLVDGPEDESDAASGETVDEAQTAASDEIAAAAETASAADTSASAEAAATADTASEKASEDKAAGAEEKEDAEDGPFKAGTLTADGDGYKITLDYTEEAKIPQNAELSVREITAETDKEAYEACLEQAGQQVAADEKTGVDRKASRFFDIEILVKDTDSEGKEETRKIEPAAPVSVNIQLIDDQAAKDSGSKDSKSEDSGSKDQKSSQSEPAVLHFAEEGVEQIDAEVKDSQEQKGDKDKNTGEQPEPAAPATEISFEAESFSIYGVVYTVDFHWVVDGKEYEFSLRGGGFVSFTDLVEVLGITGDTNSGNNEDENEEVIEEITEENGVNERAEKNGVDSDTNTAPILDEVEVSESARKFVADVASVEFSSPELVDVSKVEEDTTVGQIKENRALECEYSAGLTEEQIAEINAQTVEAPDWALISLHPFTSEEELTVTMEDGEVFTIRVTDAQIKKNVIDSKGDTWEIIVTCGEDAQIPDGAELKVREILPEDEEYVQYYKKSLEKVGVNAPETEEPVKKVVSDYARLFDIEIWYDDHKVEPAADVTVNIKLLDAPEETEATPQVVHFAKAGAELIELKEKAEKSEEEGIQFVTDEFSVYSVVYTVDFSYEVNGKVYGFTMQGEGSVSLRALIEALHVYEKTADEEKSDGEANEVEASVSSEDLADKEAEQESAGENQALNEFMSDIKSVEFSNPELLAVCEVKTDTTLGKLNIENGIVQKYTLTASEPELKKHNAKLFKAGDWALISLNPFDTEECLKIGLTTGEEFTIKVTDDQDAQMVGDHVLTVSNPAGTTIDLFDYWINDDLRYTVGRGAWPGGYDGNGWTNDWEYRDIGLLVEGQGTEAGINEGHAFKFTPAYAGTVRDGTTNYKTVDSSGRINSYTGSEAMGWFCPDPNQGIVQNTLSSGYPILTNDSAKGTNGESLAYLFDPTISHQGKESYSGVDQFLYVDKDGYYRYDSRDYKADYNYDGTFTLTEQTAEGSDRGFWPFGTSTYWSGMHINAQFSMPENGKVLNPRGEYKDMQFEFSGDDDTWIYVDGVLIGDGGGIHNRCEIDINFATGNVIINNTVVGTLRGFIEAAKSAEIAAFTPEELEKWNAQWDGNTFAAGTYHTFDMFYLERGGDESNLYIKYNLVSTADFTAHKSYSGYDEDDVLQRNQFRFELIGLDGKYRSVKDVSTNDYVLVQEDMTSKAIMPHASSTGAGTTVSPYYDDNYSVEMSDGTTVSSQIYITGNVEDGNVNFGNAQISEQDMHDCNEGNPPVYRYIVREVVPDDAVNADNITWANATPEQRAAGGFVKDSIEYDNAVYYMAARVTSWTETDASGTPRTRYGLSKTYYTDDTYTTKKESTPFIDFRNTYQADLASFEFDKVDANEEPVEGAVFQLFRDSACKIPAKGSDNQIITATSTSNGKVSFSNIRTGIYFMKEVTAPEPYDLNPTVYRVTISKQGSHMSVNSDQNNTPVTKVYNMKSTDITVRKKWVNQNGEEVSGAEHPVTVQLKRYRYVSTAPEPETHNVTLHFHFPDAGWNVPNKVFGPYTVTGNSVNIHWNVSGCEFFWDSAYTQKISNGDSLIQMPLTNDIELDIYGNRDWASNNLNTVSVDGAIDDSKELQLDADFPSENEQAKATQVLTAEHPMHAWSFGVGDEFDFPPGDELGQYLYYVVELNDQGEEVAIGGEVDEDMTLLSITYEPEKTDDMGITHGLITVTNEVVEETPAPVDITVLKVDDDNNDIKLGGATFELTKVQSLETNNQVTDGAYSESGTTSDADDETKGKLLFTGLTPGYYYLHETKSPDGYVITTNGWHFQIDENGIVSGVGDFDPDGSFRYVDENNIEVTNQKGVALPNTGGPGTRLYTILGTILILGAGVLLCRRRRLI